VGLPSRVLDAPADLTGSAAGMVRASPAEVLDDLRHVGADDAVLVMVPAGIAGEVLADLDDLTGRRRADDQLRHAPGQKDHRAAHLRGPRRGAGWFHESREHRRPGVWTDDDRSDGPRPSMQGGRPRP